MFVNEVVNEVPGVFVLKRLLVDTCLVEELLQIWVDILEVKTMVGVPANVTDVLEICWHANVLLVQPGQQEFNLPRTLLWVMHLFLPALFSLPWSLFLEMVACNAEPPPKPFKDWGGGTLVPLPGWMDIIAESVYHGWDIIEIVERQAY